MPMTYNRFIPSVCADRKPLEYFIFNNFIYQQKDCEIFLEKCELFLNEIKNFSIIRKIFV